jgi:hypothetical protein
VEQFHHLNSRPTTLSEDKDISGLKMFVEHIRAENTNEDWVDGDVYFGVNDAK